MKRLLFPLAIAAALAFPGTASANAFDADANCDGMTFTMPRTEDGTQVFATRNGQTVADVRNDVFGAPVRFTIPSPDRTVAQTWRVTVIGYNGTLRWSETVPACDVPAPTTTTVPTTSTTVPPVVATTSTTVPATTTTADFPPPPVPTSSTTVITTPRPTTTTTTTPGVPTEIGRAHV